MNELLSGLNGGSVPTLELIYLLTLVALLPSIVIMMTSFTRIIIIYPLPEMLWVFSKRLPTWFWQGLLSF